MTARATILLLAGFGAGFIFTAVILTIWGGQ
jgi:hypothetical protein